MSKSNNIRLRKSDYERIDKEVNRFNRKINRILRADASAKDYLPQKINKKEFIKQIQNSTRQDFNRELRSIDRFMKRGAEKKIVSKTGNVVTKWEKNEIANKVREINRRRTIERNKILETEATSQGNPLGMKRKEMGSERVDELRPKKFDFDKINKGREWELFVKSVEKQIKQDYYNEKNDLFKRNYISAIERAYNSEGSKLLDIIKLLSSDEIVLTYYREQEASIDFHYDPIDAQIKLEILEELWSNVLLDSITP